MIYAVSDIHGNYEKYEALMEKISYRDTLYVLGDVVDRGLDGLKILLDMRKLVMERGYNIIRLLGNHECLALLCLPMLVKILNERNSDSLNEDELRTFAEWVSDGGSATVSEFTTIDPKYWNDIFTALKESLPYAEVSAGGKDFVLVHAGLSRFSPDKKISEYKVEELLFTRPNLNKTYFEDKYLVFGHTPTQVLRKKVPDGKGGNEIYEHGKLIGIDCGCSYGGELGCLCLDTMERFYL